MFLIAALLLAPPFEEMLFRGVLYAGYRRSLGAGKAAFLTTTIFVVLHLTEALAYWPSIIAITAMALLALRMRLRSSAIGPAVALHFGYNLMMGLIVVWQTLASTTQGFSPDSEGKTVVVLEERRK
jgi:membrane protease YdiL (CAAX protease family)